MKELISYAKGDFLNHYTSLPVLLHFLTNRRIILGDPEKWEDENDKYYIRCYKKEKGIKTLLAVCFSYTRETYHHWKCYAPGKSGVCIEFKKDSILARINQDETLKSRIVNYKFINQIGNLLPTPEHLPFIKRWPFADEDEFRVIYTNIKANQKASIEFKISDIKVITLSPWLSKDIFLSIAKALKSIDGCESLEIVPSSLLDNKRWKLSASLLLVPRRPTRRNAPSDIKS